MESDTNLSAADFYRRIQAVLQSLFPENWLTTAAPPDHPARQDWELCDLLARQGGSVALPDQRRLLPLAARTFLGTFAWLSIAADSSVSTLHLGDIDGYGDSAVTRKIRSRVRDPRGYHDLLLELTVGGTHRRAGRLVTPFERDGYPDIRVDGGAVPLFVECKRIYTMTPDRLRKVIQRANNQVKRAAIDLGEAHDGVVVLDLTGALPLSFGSFDWRPPLVDAAIEAAQRALSGSKNRSLRQAVISWGDFRYVTRPGQTTVVSLRRVVAIEHAGPAVVANSKLDPYPEFTGALALVRKGTTLHQVSVSAM